jgi:Holliday junction resolvase
MTPEAKVKKKVVAQLDELGAYNFFPVMGGYGRSGIPDVIGCYRGCFFAIECKAGKNTPTALQERELQKIRDAGGIAIVVNEENIDAVKAALQAHTGPRL